MITLSFGKWSGSSTRWFRIERIYWRRYKWTPFCRVKRRYPTVATYRERIARVQKLVAVQRANANCDDYYRGLYNGLELALATMEDREPGYVKKKGIDE